MESTGDVESSASARLREYARLDDTASERTPSRGYWWLMLWSAILISAYVGVYLSTFGGTPAGEVAERAGGQSATWVMLTPVLAFGSLLNGARERFDIRARPSLLHWGLSGLAMAGFVALGVLTIAGVAYPWWLNAVVPLVILIAMGATPLRRLITTSRGSIAPWGASALGPASRLMTAFLGVAIGVLLVTSVNTLAAAVSALIVMAFLIVVLASWRSSFGLPRVGYEWGATQWTCFGASAAIVFASVLLTNVADWFTAPYTVAAGVLVFLIMGVAALSARRETRREP